MYSNSPESFANCYFGSFKQNNQNVCKSQVKSLNYLRNMNIAVEIQYA